MDKKIAKAVELNILVYDPDCEINDISTGLLCNIASITRELCNGNLPKLVSVIHSHRITGNSIEILKILGDKMLIQQDIELLYKYDELGYIIAPGKNSLVLFEFENNFLLLGAY
jgi:hypothetical protein